MVFRIIHAPWTQTTLNNNIRLVRKKHIFTILIWSFYIFNTQPNVVTGSACPPSNVTLDYTIKYLTKIMNHRLLNLNSAIAWKIKISSNVVTADYPKVCQFPVNSLMGWTPFLISLTKMGINMSYVFLKRDSWNKMIFQCF